MEIIRERFIGNHDKTPRFIEGKDILYCCWDSDGGYCKVGHSVDPITRFQKHTWDDPRYRMIIPVLLVQCDEVKDARNLEKLLIQQLNKFANTSLVKGREFFKGVTWDQIQEITDIAIKDREDYFVHYLIAERLELGDDYLIEKNFSGFLSDIDYHYLNFE